ncbi:MAG TPA: folate-binding protein [Methylophilaceae bacterium]
MTTILWNEQLAANGAVMHDGHVTHFGDAAAELQAAAHGNIIADLSHLGLLEVGGDEAVKFLQGQLTNDVSLLNGNNSQYAGYCTPKGRMLAMFLAFAHFDHVHLQLNGALTESIMKRLKMYVMRSKVTIQDVSDSIIRFGVAGDDTPAALAKIFERVPSQTHELITMQNGALIRLPGAIPRYQGYANAQNMPEIWAQLSKTCKPVGFSCWEWLEIQAGIPDITPATQEVFVPQMVNLDVLDGINFKKGCYTGQEIVARTHYLGKVKRRTHLAHIATDQTPQAGDDLFGETADSIGKIVRAAPAPQGGFDVLAELRLESVETVAIHWKALDGAVLELRELPYSLS